MSRHVTRDRGEILHLAGRRRLSPALRDGAPRLVPVGDTAGRCGWEAFFTALEREGLAVASEGEAGAVELVRADG